MDFKATDEFTKEFDKLKKKYRTLDTDLELLKKLLRLNPAGDGSKHWNLLKHEPEAKVHLLKVRMMCRAARGSQFRVTYAYQENKIEILFIEIYYKGNKENENMERAERYLKLLLNKSDV